MKEKPPLEKETLQNHIDLPETFTEMLQQTDTEIQTVTESGEKNGEAVDG